MAFISTLHRLVLFCLHWVLGRGVCVSGGWVGVGFGRIGAVGVIFYNYFICGLVVGKVFFFFFFSFFFFFFKLVTYGKA